MKIITPDNGTKELFEKNKDWGLHAVIDLYDCDPDLIKSFPDMEKFVVELCQLIDMKMYGKTLIERFAEGYYEGCSLLQFIETSSITAHFDERENRAFIDVFSCKYFDTHAAANFCKEYFKANDHLITTIIRD
jgi:S-adenosylmethionine/arginine decarboxylase-like enzyme